jgi:hypothetical protein
VNSRFVASTLARAIACFEIFHTTCTFAHTFKLIYSVTDCKRIRDNTGKYLRSSWCVLAALLLVNVKASEVCTKYGSICG